MHDAMADGIDRSLDFFESVAHERKGIRSFGPFAICALHLEDLSGTEHECCDLQSRGAGVQNNDA